MTERQSSAGALDHLYKAVFLLAAEAGRIEERLSLAYHTHIVNIDEQALPASARGEFAKIRAALKTLFPRPGHSENIDREQAISIAMAIILLYDGLSR